MIYAVLRREIPIIQWVFSINPIWIICFCTQGTIQQNIFLSDLCCLRHHAYAIFPRFPGSPGTYIVPMLRSIPYKKQKRFTHRFLSSILLPFSTVIFLAVEKEQIAAVQRKGNELSSDCKKEIFFLPAHDRMYFRLTD